MTNTTLIKSVRGAEAPTETEMELAERLDAAITEINELVADLRQRDRDSDDSRS